MARFIGFKPQGIQKIASRMGYTGSMDDFDSYLEQNPEKKRQMVVYESLARQMAKGGVVRMQEGGATPPSFITDPIYTIPPAELNLPNPNAQADPRQLPQADVPVGSDYTPETGIGDVFTDRAQDPSLPEGGVTIPVGTQVTQDQLISGDTGQVEGTVGVSTAQATTTTQQLQDEKEANLTTAERSSTGVDSALAATNAAQTSLEDPRASVVAAQQTATSVGDLNAAQGQAIELQNPAKNNKYKHLRTR